MMDEPDAVIKPEIGGVAAVVNGPVELSDTPIPPPRIWPVLLTWLIAILTGLVGTVAMVILIGIGYAATGSSRDALAERVHTDPVLALLLMVPMQAVFMAAALLYPLVSRKGATELLGLGRPTYAPVSWPIIIAATPVPFVIGVLLSLPMPSLVDQDAMTRMWAGMSLPVGVAFVLFIGLSPGFGEELLFRGLIQRRLVPKLGAVWAISISSLLFAVSHLDPAQSAFALPLGVWFGYVSWRTGSIWLTVVCHTLVNMTSSTVAILIHQNHVNEVVTGLLLILLFLAGCVCFLATFLVFYLPRPTPSHAASWTE